jgi:hypothetical protein
VLKRFAAKEQLFPKGGIRPGLTLLWETATLCMKLVSFSSALAGDGGFSISSGAGADGVLLCECLPDFLAVEKNQAPGLDVGNCPPLLHVAEPAQGRSALRDRKKVFQKAGSIQQAGLPIFIHRQKLFSIDTHKFTFDSLTIYALRLRAIECLHIHCVYVC